MNDVIPADAIRSTGRQWRAIAAEAAPFDLTAANPVIPASCRRRIPAIGVEATITRDRGFRSGGFIPLLGAECAFHLNLAFTDLAGAYRPHDHDAAGFLCEGLFGKDLQHVVCQRQNPNRGRWRDAWHYLLFVRPDDWRTPIPGIVPEGYLTWQARLLHVAAPPKPQETMPA